jgi:hypothetical protein
MENVSKAFVNVMKVLLELPATEKNVLIIAIIEDYVIMDLASV